MNLLEDEWLSVVRRNGEQEKLQGLWQITHDLTGTNPITDVLVPRADFKGALYQLLIGLVQTTFAPKDEDVWEHYWLSPPDPQTLKAAFLTVTPAFAIGTGTPAFMQDYELLADKQAIGIASLLIDTSGGGTFFVKEGTTQQVSPYWANIALFTLQTNAPSGGSGHRTSLRGGGPLTTLVLPNESQQAASLWQKLWLNIFTQNEVGSFSGNTELTDLAAIFPWLAPTRTSAASNKDFITYPEQGHPYQMYWGMPRRIRLDINNLQTGVCDICHEPSEQLLTHYRTQNLGVNYSSTWLHPLTPYVRDPKKEAYSVKAQVGGISYRHWLGLVLADDKNHKQAAKVVTTYINSRQELIGGDYQPRLWLFGYDMDNMKARCWYETTMPVFPIPRTSRDSLQADIGKMLDAATEVALDVRSTLKQAWFTKPKEAKGEITFTDPQFWQTTETDFYRLLEQLIHCGDNEAQVKLVFTEWKRVLRTQALSLFDHWALSSNNEDGDMKRVITARRQLEIWLNAGKNIKALAA
ncbi:MAG: type I-E CRISPR-associated protein Cse1/CasA [Methylococcaceae bacterium]|nr:type I-E CRISPR-associated protein Cse1/CasA [Methylococcaceae bacterium]